MLGLIGAGALIWFLFPDGGRFLVCFFAGASVVVFLASKVVGALLAPTQKLHEELTRTLGFAPCTADVHAQLKNAVATLKRWKHPDGFALRDPVRAEINRRSFFQYYYSETGRSMGSTGHISSRGAVREFEMVVPFARKSDGYVIVLLGRDEGVVKALEAQVGTFASLVAQRWSSPDHPVAVLDLAPELRERGVSTILGAPGSTVGQLLDPDEIAVILRGAACEVDHVVASGGIALLSFRKGYLSKDGYAKLPAYLAELGAR